MIVATASTPLPLGEVASVFNGKTPAKPEQRSDGHPVLKIRDMDEAGAFRGSFESYVDPELAEQFSEKWLRLGDTLILNAAHNADYVGSKTAYATKEIAGSLPTGEWLVIRARDGVADPLYIHYLTTAGPALRAIRGLVKGIHLYPSDVARVPVQLPSLVEQKRIAAILEKADAIRRRRQEAARLADTLTPNLYFELFGDPLANNRKWPTGKVDTLCDLVRGSSPRPRSDPTFYGGPIPRLMIEDITRDGKYVTPRIDTLTELGATMSRPVVAGTVVMAVSGNVGLVARLLVDACIHDGFVGFRDLDTKVVQPDYFMWTLDLLKSSHSKRKVGAIWQNLTTHQVKAMDIPLPPPPLQNRFETLSKRLADVAKEYAARSQAVDDLFNSLVQRAFRGEL